MSARIRVLGTVAAMGGALLLAPAPGSGAAAKPATDPDTAGIAQATCFWFGPMGIDDPASNLAYPDAGALYWGARFRVPDGATLRFNGRFPHARYMSLNSYGRVEGIDHAAVDSLEDTAIRPDRGSVNPFRTGARRDAERRAYRITMTDNPTGPNQLDAPTTNAGAVQELIYRVYLPDRAKDAAPKSLPRPTLELANGSVVRGRALCAAINDPQRHFDFQAMPPALYTSLVNTPGADPTTNSAQPQVRWEKFLNQRLALSVYRLGTPVVDTRLADLALGEVGGYYDNRDVRYSVGPINAAYGKVLVLRGKLPTTPRTGPTVRRMGTGQMRYWSICQNTSPVETKAIDCVSDADVRDLVDKQRRFTIVVSTRADRPANARARCDVAWLDWGNERDILGRQTGTLLLRNLDADPDFPHSLQQVGPDDVDVIGARNLPEQRVMRDYQPSGRYTSTSAFERRGCSGRVPGRG